MNWKPIKDCPMDTDVLIVCKDGEMYVAYFWSCNGRWKVENCKWVIRCECVEAEDSFNVYPIAYMALPEPPKEVE